jgi:hypothetical protein
VDDNLSAEAVSQRLKAIGTSALEGYPCELSDTDAQALIQAATTLEQVKREHGETFRNAVGWQTRAQAAERERDEARADFQRRDLDALDQMLARAAAEAQVEALRKALEEIRDLKPRKKELPADHWDQIRACPECQRYAGHPVQQGICDAHRRPMWDREKHNAHEESILGYRAMEIARNALASSPERKPCTCHPADNPPVPCAGKYALTECRKAEESSAKAVLTLTEAMLIAEAGYDAWAAKPHNKGWRRKIDGTPIPNDLPVCIAQAFYDALKAAPAEARAVYPEGDHG